MMFVLRPNIVSNDPLSAKDTLLTENTHCPIVVTAVKNLQPDSVSKEYATKTFNDSPIEAPVSDSVLEAEVNVPGDMLEDTTKCFDISSVGTPVCDLLKTEVIVPDALEDAHGTTSVASTNNLSGDRNSMEVSTVSVTEVPENGHRNAKELTVIKGLQLDKKGDTTKASNAPAGDFPQAKVIVPEASLEHAHGATIDLSGARNGTEATATSATDNAPTAEADNEPRNAKDLLLVLTLDRAKCPLTVTRMKDLDGDKKARDVFYSKKTVKRFISRSRSCPDPNGPSFKLAGKRTSNGIRLWGATLLDFFLVDWVPNSISTVVTSSRVLEWVTKNNGTENSRREIEWAEKEADPRQLQPYSILNIIEAQELNIRLGLCGVSRSIDNQNEKVRDSLRPNANDIFSEEAYPAPWPLIPFSYQAPPLEQRIPMFQLPKKHIVHDPFDVLSVSRSRYEYAKGTYDWTATEDITYVYDLTLFTEGKERTKEGLELPREERPAKRQKRLEEVYDSPEDVKTKYLPDGSDGFVIQPPTIIPDSPADIPVLVIHEAPPNPPQVEVAHLYLSPDQLLGEGHHSLVANAEWEIPRSLLVPDILCYECILNDVRETLAAQDGADGSTKSEQWKQRVGSWKEVADTNANSCLDLASEGMPQSLRNTGLSFTIKRGAIEKKFRYDGPVRPIKTDVKWQNLERGPYCSHILKRMHVKTMNKPGESLPQAPHPLTAKVSVVAKLSHWGDMHLENEADYYQRFPQHLFEHWNGYNIVHPRRHPVPVGAVLPQFYGYYKPNKDLPVGKLYLSPILLLEKCGSQVQVRNLSADDRYECASLYYRLHNAGYSQESVYERNVVHQDGPIDRPRYQRGTGEFAEDGRKHCFRLIDFGRAQSGSLKYELMMVEATFNY